MKAFEEHIALLLGEQPTMMIDTRKAMFGRKRKMVGGSKVEDADVGKRTTRNPGDFYTKLLYKNI